MEALLLSSDLVQLVACALDQLVWVLTVDEALGIDCEAELDHFVQFRLLLLQFADVETKRTELFVDHIDNFRVLIADRVEVLE